MDHPASNRFFPRGDQFRPQSIDPLRRGALRDAAASGRGWGDRTLSGADGQASSLDRGAARAELSRVFGRELSRLLWQAAFRALGVEHGVVRARRTVVMDRTLDLSHRFEPLARDLRVLRRVGERAGCSLADLERLANVSGRIEASGEVDVETAYELAEAAVRQHRGVTDSRRWAVFARARGRVREARAILREALDRVLDSAGEPVGGDLVLADLARLDLGCAAPQAAREWIEEALGWPAEAKETDPEVVFDALAIAFELDDERLLEAGRSGVRRNPQGAQAALGRATARIRHERPASLLAASEGAVWKRVCAEPGCVGRFARSWSQSVFVERVR